MLSLIYDFFYQLFYLYSDTPDSVNQLDSIMDSPVIMGRAEITMVDYLCFICSLVSIIIIVVLCCLFIGKIIKTIGRLFSGGTL